MLSLICSYSIALPLFDNRVTDVTGESSDAHAVEFKTISRAGDVKRPVKNAFTALPCARADQRLESQRKASRERMKQEEVLVLSTCLRLAVSKFRVVYSQQLRLIQLSSPTILFLPFPSQPATQTPHAQIVRPQLLPVLCQQCRMRASTSGGLLAIVTRT